MIQTARIQCTALAPRRRWLLGAAIGLAACTGNIGDRQPGGAGNIGEDPSALCTSKQPGESPIRRMTRVEYDNTVRDLLGDTSEPAKDFVVEEEALGFNNQATALGVTQLLAEQYMEASEKVAANATADAAKLAQLLDGCDPAADGADVCGEKFVEAFGQKAFRRLLQPDEVQRLNGVFTWGLTEYDFTTGIQLVIQAMLQSPHFLYRVEFGMPDPVENDVVALDHYEVASRLSYMLWNSMPDEELFAAAAAGELGTAEQIAKQARRMLDDDKARQAVANFHEQWLQLGKIESINKDSAIYPTYDDALRPMWKSETQAFLDYVVFDDAKGDVETLLTANYTFLNKELADFYGVTGPTGSEFEKVDTDSAERAGFLTQASVLAVNAKPNQSSPVHRGKFVRERLLCQILPPPPNNIQIKAPDLDPNLTTRERFNQHDKDPFCAGCHKLMDPIGLGFEHYDGVGLWRDKENGKAVDATGQINDSDDIDGPFDGAVELAHKLAESDQVRQCVATQWFRFGYGRAEQKGDQCNLEKVQDAFAAANYNVKELLVALTQTDAFIYRRKVVPEGGGQ